MAILPDLSGSVFQDLISRTYRGFLGSRFPLAVQEPAYAQVQPGFSGFLAVDSDRRTNR